MFYVHAVFLHIPDVSGSSVLAPINEEEVMKRFGTISLWFLRVLTVFFELLDSTGSRSSGLIKAWEAGSCSGSDRGSPSVLSAA